MKKYILNHVLKNDFLSFFYKSFNELNPGIKLVAGWYLEAIAETLNQVIKGKIKRIIINIPPRYLKSQMINVAWVAWLLGNYPNKKIISVSYSQILSNKHSLDCRNLIKTDWYKKIFPNMKILADQNQKSKFMTDQQGFRFATSIGGTVTGEGGDIIIVDDPHNPKQAMSATNREQVINWYQQTLTSRLNDKKNGVIIIVMQRLHPEDLTGYLLNFKSSNWFHLSLPAIVSEHTCIQIGDKKFFRPANNLLLEERENLNDLNNIKNEMGLFAFSSQYLQQPIQHESNLIKKEWINYYHKLPDEFSLIIQSWDTAFKISDHNDYSVLTSWGIKEDKYYLINLIRVKKEFYELIQLINNQALKFKADYVLIEDKASGQSLIQELKRTTSLPIIPIKPHRDKKARFLQISSLFIKNQVLFPYQAEFLPELLNEIFNFPNAAHDDQVDSISQGLNYLNNLYNKKIYISKL